MTKDSVFAIRAVQMDLAREPQSVAFIEAFIDFIAAHSFNTLVMYLEGRIRTPSFHALSEEESYSVEEMKEVVRYATEKGIEIIPVVSMLGHANLFFQNEGLDDLAELRGGIKGRFSTVKQMFCPSNPESLKFLERYLTEVLEIFPSRYFHAGFDESWDIGYCSQCRDRLEKEGQAKIFLDYLLACHDIVVRKLGRKMMIWDDMLELYADLLEKLPRDMIMCAWHYESDLEIPGGHIGTGRRDIFAEYDRLGFSYFFAPATHSWRNIETYTDFVVRKGYRPLGAFLTSWGLGSPLWQPVIAAAGRLWSEGLGDVKAGIREVAGLQDEKKVTVIQKCLDHTAPYVLPSAPADYLQGMLTTDEYDSAIDNDLNWQILGAVQSEPVQEAASVQIGKMKLFFRLRKFMPVWYGLQKSELSEDDLRKELAEMHDQAAAFRSRQEQLGRRYGYTERILREMNDLTPVMTMLEKLAADPRPRNDAYLHLRIPWTLEHGLHGSISVMEEGGKEFRTIWSGGCFRKMCAGEFQQYLPVELAGRPRQVKIEVRGSVGASLAYLEILKGTEIFRPVALTDIFGKVENPEYLLKDGRNWSVFGDGEQAARVKFLDPVQGQYCSGVTMLMQRV